MSFFLLPTFLYSHDEWPNDSLFSAVLYKEVFQSEKNYFCQQLNRKIIEKSFLMSRDDWLGCRELVDPNEKSIIENFIWKLLSLTESDNGTA